QSYLERTRSLSNRAGFYLKVLSVAHRNLTIDEIAQIVNDEQDLVVEVLNELILFSCVKKDFNSLDVSVENKALSQVVRDNLVVKENKEISRSLGEWCEIHEPDSYVELARYFKSSEIIDKAKKYILDAAKKLEKAYNCSEAIRYYEMAKDYCNNNNEELTQLTRSIAKLNVVMGRYTEAAKEWERLDSDSKTILEDYLGLGSAYAKMHNFEKAKSWYEKGLGRISDETAIADIVKFKNNLGNIYFYMGDFGNSEKYFTEAIGDATICLLLDNNLGLILNAKGQYKDAVNFYETRKRYLEAKDDKRSLALCYAESGYIHTTNNHFEEAISDFEKSYDLSSQIDEWHNLFIVLGNLIRIYQQLAKYTKALEAANKSLKMEGRLGSLEDLAQTHLTVGILYESLAVFDLAEQHIDMARDRFIATNNEMM
ncbi:MAG: hypothetical protein COS89_06630, partial [Deltaproteobacteria bacterium CG07_land_8_20_14_0_80_38_7]